MVDVARDARWGRVMEGAGEDPLGSKIAVARVQGFQGEDLAATNTILACAKHFADMLSQNLEEITIRLILANQNCKIPFSTIQSSC
jgi:hypothetical protein